MFVLKEVGEGRRNDYTFETFEEAWTEMERLAETDKERCKNIECEIRHGSENYSRVTLGDVQEWYILEIEDK